MKPAGGKGKRRKQQIELQIDYNKNALMESERGKPISLELLLVVHNIGNGLTLSLRVYLLYERKLVNERMPNSIAQLV